MVRTTYPQLIHLFVHTKTALIQTIFDRKLNQAGPELFQLSPTPTKTTTVFLKPNVTWRGVD